jgi:hypothetical protein
MAGCGQKRYRPAASIGAGSMRNMLLSELAYAMAGKQRPLV